MSHPKEVTIFDSHMEESRRRFQADLGTVWRGRAAIRGADAAPRRSRGLWRSGMMSRDACRTAHKSDARVGRMERAWSEREKHLEAGGLPKAVGFRRRVDAEEEATNNERGAQTQCGMMSVRTPTSNVGKVGGKELG